MARGASPVSAKAPPPGSAPFRPDAEGLLTIPETPGLGIELNREALRRYGK